MLKTVGGKLFIVDCLKHADKQKWQTIRSLLILRGRTLAFMRRVGTEQEQYSNQEPSDPIPIRTCYVIFRLPLGVATAGFVCRQRSDWTYTFVIVLMSVQRHVAMTSLARGQVQYSL